MLYYKIFFTEISINEKQQRTDEIASVKSRIYQLTLKLRELKVVFTERNKDTIAGSHEAPEKEDGNNCRKSGLFGCHVGGLCAEGVKKPYLVHGQFSTF